MASEEELEKTKRKRGHVLDEIWKSEQTYVAGLDSLYENFYQPCVKFAAESSSGWLGGGSMITESEVQMVFPYVPAIRDCNHILLKQLDAEFAKSTNDAAHVTLVGPIFQRFAPVLKIYTEFMNNYQAAADTMERLCGARVSLKEWRESVEVRLMTPLGQLMITPVQRIPRYKLLLAELIKYTPEDHPDYKALMQSLNKIGEIATWINEKKRDSERIAALESIHRQVSGMIINLRHTARATIKEGTLIRIIDGADNKRQVFLFSDLLLLTTFRDYGRIGFVYDRHIPLAKATVAALGYPTMFQLTVGKEAYQFRCADTEERNAWVKTFEETLGKLRSGEYQDVTEYLIEEEQRELIAGFVEMIGGHIRSRWMKRWCVVSPYEAIVYQDPDLKTIVCYLPFDQHKVEIAPDNIIKFRHNHSGKETEIKLPDRRTLEQWNAVFILQIEAAEEAKKRPITDIAILFTKHEEERIPPPGFHIIRLTGHGLYLADLNSGSGGEDIYLIYRRDPHELPITDIAIVMDGRQSTLRIASRTFEDDVTNRSDFVDIRKTISGCYIADLNKESGGRDIFLAYRKQHGAPPITELCVTFRDKGESPPAGFQTIERTFNQKFVADLNAGSGGRNIFLSYKGGNHPNVHLIDHPISEIKIVVQGEQPPEGYFLIERTVSGEYEANCNYKSGGPQIQLAYKRQEEDEMPITDVCVVVKGKPAEDPPAGYMLIERSVSGQFAADLNLGSPGNRVYLAYQKERSRRPVTAIGLVILSNSEPLSKEHFDKGLLTNSCSGRLSGDLNGGNGKAIVHLCIRKATGGRGHEIGWSKKRGFDKTLMPQPWIKLMEEAAATPEELASPSASFQMICAVRKHYFRVRTTPSYLLTAPDSSGAPSYAAPASAGQYAAGAPPSTYGAIYAHLPPPETPPPPPPHDEHQDDYSGILHHVTNMTPFSYTAFSPPPSNMAPPPPQRPLAPGEIAPPLPSRAPHAPPTSATAVHAPPLPPRADSASHAPAHASPTPTHGAPPAAHQFPGPPSTVPSYVAGAYPSYAGPPANPYATGPGYPPATPYASVPGYPPATPYATGPSYPPGAGYPPSAGYPPAASPYATPNYASQVRYPTPYEPLTSAQYPQAPQAYLYQAPIPLQAAPPPPQHKTTLEDLTPAQISMMAGLLKQELEVLRQDPTWIRAPLVLQVEASNLTA